jgi:hypothetical protein
MSLPISAAVTRCSGVTGAFDLFIVPSGSVVASQNGLTLALHFSGRSAEGTVSASGCGRRAVSAHLKA